MIHLTSKGTDPKGLRVVLRPDGSVYFGHTIVTCADLKNARPLPDGRMSFLGYAIAPDDWETVLKLAGLAASKKLRGKKIDESTDTHHAAEPE